MIKINVKKTKCLWSVSDLNVLTVFVVPMLLNVKTVYDAVIAVAVMLLMLILSIGSLMILSVFSLEIYRMPISVMLCGAAYVAITVLGKSLTDHISCVAACSFLCAMIISSYFESISGNVKIKLFTVLKTTGIFVGIVVISSLIRELIASGTFFKGFTENGITILPFRAELFGKAWGYFLILSLIFFILSRFISMSEFSLEGISVATLISGVIALMLGSGYYWLTKADLGSVTLIAPFLCAALLMQGLRLITTSINSEYISFAMLLSLLSVSCEGSFLLYFIKLAVICVTLWSTSIIAEYSAWRSGTKGISSALIFCSLCTYFIELFLL